MEKSIDYVGLVQQAQLGDKECLNRLAEAVRERLYSYVYRYTLADDLANDIVQESILKMLEALGELRKADQFWPWLYKIALNKIRLHHRNEQHHRTISDPDMNQSQDHKDSQDAIAGMVYQEFKKTVFAAMRELKPEHRSVINMRCYDQMQYSEIAKVLGRSEFAAQKLFYRAKKSLKKKLARHGLGKGSLLMALVLFGKLTAPSKAAAASISVTSATIKVGTAVSVAAIAASKTAIVSLVTAGVLAGGTMVATSGNDKTLITHKEGLPRTPYVTDQAIQAGKGNVECWYYYPPNGNGAVMMRFKSDTEGERSYCQWLHNNQANYYKHNNVMYIRSCRPWADDLSVRRLPTDSPELADFLSQVEGKTVPLEYIRYKGGSLLVITKEEKDAGSLQIIHHYDVSSEEYFRYDWLGKAKTIDNRDAMHKRGWTYFSIVGQINGKQVQGKGRMPFVYAASQTHWPWLKLKVGQRIISHASFTGLSQPWMGLHTIDTVRRDAAQRGIWFETELLPDGGKAEVTLTHNRGKLVYTVDMETDVVEKITFLSEAGKLIGQLEFSYLQEIESVGNEFAEPKRRSYRQVQQNSDGMPWLFELISDK